MKSIRVVAAIIKSINETGEPVIFATQRGYGDYKDWWEFPGGKIEPGEAPEEALVREIREELDAAITVDRYLITVEYDYPAFHLSMDCFWCSLQDGHITLLEHEAAKWLPLNDLRQVDWLPADVIVVDAIEADIKPNYLEQTLLYYQQHADDFSAGTLSADMNETHKKFIKHLPPHAHILDFGCGSGRDTKVFLEKGYTVDATDGSENLCIKASEYTGINVKHMLFSELSEVEKYDGIWACASILHLEKSELLDVLNKIALALKPQGILYTSFKYGTFEGLRNGRYFTDFTEESLSNFMKNIPSLKIIDEWITQDVRPGREEERWINILAQRI